MYLQSPLLPLYERGAPVSFLAARVLQGLVLGIIAFMFLPIFWGVFYPVLSGDIAFLASRPFDLVALALRPFPKAEIACVLLALILALRSASWGRVGLLFCLTSSLIVAALVEMSLYGLAILCDESWLSMRGLSRDNSSIWLASWGLAGACFYLIIRLGLFHHRPLPNDRPRTVAAFWMLLLYIIYAPIIYELVQLRLLYGEDLIWYRAQGLEFETGQSLSWFLACLCGLAAVVSARRMKEIKNLTLILLPFASGLLFFMLVISLHPDMEAQDMLAFGQVIFLYALMLSACISGIRWDSWHAVSDRRGIFALKIWGIIFLLGPPLYQMMSLTLRGLIIGLPPFSFYLATIELAYLHVGLIFAGTTALYAYFAARIHYPALFLCALVTSAASLFLPAPHLGIGLGGFVDHIGWPMLLLLPIILVMRAFAEKCV